jgi:murein DD-endopeptidase MepM/ murein hydrolase activator NlpD
MNAVWNDPCYRDVDLGDEEPLVTADNRKGPPDRRQVSLRWLAGTVLAAMASTSLMGGALYVALDGRQSIAMPVDRLASAIAATSAADAPADMVFKSDMQTADNTVNATRQVLKVSTITRDGDADLIRMKPFARVSTPLVARSSDVVDPIPVFNPLRIFADANVDSDGIEDTLYGVAVDGQMTVKVRDFPVDDPSLDADPALDIASTELLVRDNARFLEGASVQVASLPFIDPQRFEFGFAEPNAFDQFGVRVIPENVSFVATTPLENVGLAAGYTEQKTAVAGKDDDLEAILTENEATDEEAAEIAIQLRRGFGYEGLSNGDRVKVDLAPAGDETGRYRPIRVSVYRDGGHLGTVALSDRQGYVAAEEPRNEGDDLFAAAGQAELEADAPRPRLYESLYQTALSNGMSPELINQMVRIFSFDVDFNTRVAPGDTLEVVYSLDEDESESADVTEIVYTALTIAGKTRRFYRYKAPDDGSVDYYDDEGRSAKKFLLRKPMTGGTFRSGFGARKHPLLGYVRAHSGVDWSAPRGTPIMAAGDGEIVYADWKSGYGNYIMIRHNNGYESAYAHQTGFAKGITKGAKVRQGQVIGFVGSTGLSTGPHLHYEVHVNGNAVDPMRIKVPRGRSLEGDILAAYTGERERIDTLLGGGVPPRLTTTAAASLD